MMQLPPALRPGDKIGVFAPSSPGAALYPDRFKRGLAALEKSLGCDVYLPRGFEHAGVYTAGTAQERAQDFLELVTEPAVRAIITTFGGYNSSDLLSLLSPQELRANPKILIGYSDTTALLLGYQAMTGLVSYYGPAVLPQFGEYPEPFDYTVTSLKRSIVQGKGGFIDDPLFWTDEIIDWARPELTRPRHLKRGAARRHWRLGCGEGTLFGGNVATLNFLVGTPYFAVPEHGIVLFLEATGEEARLPVFRRALVQLRHCGLFDQVRALLVGRFPRCSEEQVADIRELLLEIGSAYDFPILGELAFGHTDPMMTLPIGCHARVQVKSDTSTIEIIGPTVSCS
ncbi:MAG TPA: S66 peptidase family protein [Ktedonobacteraceae bacterium]|nr:S66 peptidase family protein [Ktedonobacteraceae bacterium]